MTISRKVPIYGKGGVIRDWAVVDDDVFEAINAHRWHIRSGVATREARLNGKVVAIAMHREILGLPVYGHPSVRHLNGNSLDNRKENLVLSRAWLSRAMAGDSALVRFLSKEAIPSIAAAA